MNSPPPAALVGHPDLPTPDAGFAAFLAEKTAGAATAATDLNLGDLHVAYHAGLGHPRALEIVGELLAALRGALRRTGASDQLVAELLEELPADLVAPRNDAPPRIAGYSGKGALGGWLRVIAVRAIVERRRRGAPPPSDVAVAADVVEQHDPELDLLRKQYAADLERALGAAFRALPDEQRLLLQQHHRDGLSVDQLAVLHGVHRATAARRVAAARDALSASVREILSRELRIGEQTFDSIVRLVRSEISLHLSRYV